jgi:hypothetical protein
MMRTLIAVAFALLAVQLALVVAFNFIDRGSAGRYQPGGPFLEIAEEAIDRVEITDEQGGKLVIARGEGGWQLPEHDKVPADMTKLAALLDRLAGLSSGLVVATSAEAANRFQVADAAFQRHILLFADGQEAANFYIGTSPGFRQVHARRAGEAAIVTVALSTFELETAPEEWLDKELVKIAGEQLVGVVFPDFTLTRQDGHWLLADLAAGETLDHDAVADLTLRVGGLTIQSVLDPQVAGPLFQGPLDLQYTLILADGSRLLYRFVKSADSYALRVSGREQVFKVHQLPVEGLQKFTRQGLLQPDQSAEGQADTAENGPEIAPPAPPAE